MGNSYPHLGHFTYLQSPNTARLQPAHAVALAYDISNIKPHFGHLNIFLMLCTFSSMFYMLMLKLVSIDLLLARKFFKWFCIYIRELNVLLFPG